MDALSEILHKISYMGLPLLFAMVLHEYAHGWVAYRCGDPTAKLQGRLTMNPLAHIDPFGSVILPLFCLLMPGGFFLGWAKPVPIDPRLMHQPRRDMALVAAAGPCMNLILAIGSALLFTILLSLDSSVAQYWSSADETPPPQSLQTMITLPLAVMAVYSLLINVLLMLFNLIPIPPLDGSHILRNFLPYKMAAAFDQIGIRSYLLMFFVGSAVINVVMPPAMHLVYAALTRIQGA